MNHRLIDIYLKTICEAAGELELTPEEMINAIKENIGKLNISPENARAVERLKKIYNSMVFLNHGNEIEEQLTKALESKIQLSSKHAEEVVEDLSAKVSVGALQEFLTFLMGPNRLNIGNYVGKRTSIPDLIAATKLKKSDRIFEYFFHKCLQKKTATGEGELFCAIIFDEGKMPSGKGDVAIANDELEVKATGKSGAKLRSKP
jgi:hypothetical protein